MRLSHVTLCVRSPEALAKFYVDHFGMRASPSRAGVLLSFGGADADIELLPSDSLTEYTHSRADRYWKVGLAVPNADAAAAALRRAGVQVSDPHQFGDIGYMCHLDDPAGFKLELLQQTFGARGTEAIDSDSAFAGTHVGQITLRTADLDADLAFYRDKLGMKLLSIQNVDPYGFVLYFLAFTNEEPPNPDRHAVENRAWLYQRPYTTLELQHFPDRKEAFKLPKEGQPGLSGISISRAKESVQLEDGAGGRVELMP